jgi:formate hydrogenlyase subunit 3/multisubunit Na+/H+ antiporter MnhD subunit
LPPPRIGVVIVAPIAFLVGLSLALAALAGPVSRLTTQAAADLLDRHAYVRAVLGEEVPRAAR